VSAPNVSEIFEAFVSFLQLRSLQKTKKNTNTNVCGFTKKRYYEGRKRKSTLHGESPIKRKRKKRKSRSNI